MCSHRGTDRGAGGKNEIDRHHLVLDQVAIKANLLTVLVQQHHIRNRRFAIKDTFSAVSFAGEVSG
jgi:hypothetical protein